MEQERFTLFASVHILFIKENQILLSLRKNISSDGMYGLVAGHVEEGEPVTQTAIREAQEEIGVEIDKDDIEFVSVCHSFNEKNGKEFVQFYFFCKKWRGEIENKEPEKCGEVKFFPLDNLPKNMVPYTLDAIGKIFSGIHFFEYGWGKN